MAVKTITIELDAYDLLKSKKLSDKESFSQVIRRLVGSEEVSGPSLAKRARTLQLQHGRMSDSEFLAHEDVQREDKAEEPDGW